MWRDARANYGSQSMIPTPSPAAAESGSFLMELALYIQNNLRFITSAIERAKHIKAERRQKTNH